MNLDWLIKTRTLNTTQSGVKFIIRKCNDDITTAKLTRKGLSTKTFELNKEGFNQRNIQEAKENPDASEQLVHRWEDLTMDQ